MSNSEIGGIQEVSGALQLWTVAIDKLYFKLPNYYVKKYCLRNEGFDYNIRSRGGSKSRLMDLLAFGQKLEKNEGLNLKPKKWTKNIGLSSRMIGVDLFTFKFS